MRRRAIAGRVDEHVRREAGDALRDDRREDERIVCLGVAPSPVGECRARVVAARHATPAGAPQRARLRLPAREERARTDGAAERLVVGRVHREPAQVRARYIVYNKVIDSITDFVGVVNSFAEIFWDNLGNPEQGSCAAPENSWR